MGGAWEKRKNVLGCHAREGGQRKLSNTTMNLSSTGVDNDHNKDRRNDNGMMDLSEIGFAPRNQKVGLILKLVTLITSTRTDVADYQ